MRDQDRRSNPGFQGNNEGFSLSGMPSEVADSRPVRGRCFEHPVMATL